MTVKDSFISDGVRLDEVLYYVGLVFWFLQTYMFRSFYGEFFGGSIVKGLRWLAVLLFIAKIMLSERRISIKLLALTSFTGAIVLTSGYKGAAGTTLLHLFILLAASKGIDFKKTCRVIGWTGLLAYTAIILTDAAGFMHYEPMVEEVRLREYLGFTYVSFPAIYFNNIVFCLLYGYTEQDPVKRRRYRGGAVTEVPWWGLLALTAAEFWIYEKSDTSLAFGVGMIFILLYALVVKLRVNVFANNALTRILSVLVFPGLSYFTYELCRRYDETSEFWLMVDDFSHNRVRMTYQGLQTYGISFLGTVIVQNTDETKGAYFYIDSGYMKNMLNYGLIFLILLLGMYSMMFYASIKEQDAVLAIWMLCAAIYSVFNNFIISPVENASFLALWYGLYLLHKSDDQKVKLRRIRKIEPDTQS